MIWVMKMDRVTASEVFNLICKLRNLSAVGRSLGISTPMVSRYLKEMENWAGVRLVHRNSRLLTLTPAGEKIFERTTKIDDLSREIESMSPKSSLNGMLRVSCNHVVARNLVTPLIFQFLESNPGIEMSLTVKSETVNLIEERIDLAISVSNQPDPNLIAKKIGTMDYVVCASPAYLEKHEEIKNLSDLRFHNCLCYNETQIKKWFFYNQGNELAEVTVHGNYSTNIFGMLCDAALKGHGIAMIPEVEAREFLKNSDLVKVLQEYKPEAVEINAIYHSRYHQLPSLRVFLDRLTEYCSRNF